MFGKRLRRRTRCVLRLIFFMPLILVLCGLLLMRSPVVGWVVEHQLEAALGCEAKIDGSFVTFDGRIVLRDISLRVPGYSGAAGEFLRADRADIDADWTQAGSGMVKPTGIRLYAPLFRVSAGRSDSILNIQGLHPTNPGAISSDGPIRIDVVSGTVELGEHAAGEYGVLREIGVTGALIPSDKEPGVYQVRFQEVRAAGAPMPTTSPKASSLGMVLDGRIDLQSSIASIKLFNVDLSTWESADVPTALRAVWEQLNIKGTIASTSLEYFPTTGLTTVITLESVSMDAIVPANFSETDPGDDVLSLREVHGTIKLSPSGLDADVAGLVETQAFPSRVILKTHDLTTMAALECKIISRSFALEKNPSLLAFCPPIVGERLANFCGPTGVVDADVIIRRATPGPDGPAPFRVSGWLNFSNGTAAFDRVPYPFTDMRGRVEFDDKQIDIVRISGVSASGATVTARGRIAPPNNEAEVRIEVNVRNLPLDRTFMESLPPSRREAIDFLFNHDRYDELLTAGLIRMPSAAETEGPPKFELGGRMDLDVNVHTPRGKDSPWHYSVDVRIPRAGVLTRAFPLPVAAQDVRLTLTDIEARLVAGQFTGLNGGRTDITADVVLEVAGEPVIRPSVVLDAKDVPLDPLLLHALAHASNHDDDASADAPSPIDLLRKLEVTGNVDCRAEIRTTPEETISFDINVAFDELDARPHAPGTEPVLALKDIAGSIHLDNTSVRVPRLTAGIRALEGVEEFSPEIAPGMDLGWISLSLDGRVEGLSPSLTPGPDHTDKAPSKLTNLRAAIDLTGVELVAPVEPSVAVFSPSWAADITALRDARQPSGRISATVDLSKPNDVEPFAITARVTAGENVMFDAGGERIETTLRAGEVAFDSTHADSILFKAVSAEVGVGKAPRAVFHAHGKVLLDTPAAGDAVERLRVTGEQIPVESAPVSLVLRHLLSAEDLATVAAARPTGAFDAAVELPSDILASRENGSFAGITAVIVPRSLSFDFEGSRVAIGAFDGRVTLGGGTIVVDRLTARAEEWNATIDGSWARDSTGAGLFGARLDLDASSLTPGIRSLFPKGLRNELDGIELAIAGPIQSRDARIEYRSGGDSRVAGELSFSDASLDIGAPLTHANGRLTLRAERSGTSGDWGIGLNLDADRLEAAGLEMTDLEASLRVGDTPGEVVLEHLAADCYAGRVTANARIVQPTEATSSAAAPDDDDRGSRYDAEITMAGVCFAPVLAALDAARVRAEGGVAEPMSTELMTDPRRGRLDGTLAISGISGDADRRSGIGSVRIGGGDVLEMPLVLTLVQLSNFQVPSSDRLDFLQAIFHVQEKHVVFDQIDLLSSSVAITGRGTMSWPDQELDLRFNSKAGTRVPLISDLFEVVRDEIATTRIRGTLSEPRVGPEPLTGTRELIGSIMGEPTALKRSTGIPDAAAERRRQREQRPHMPTPQPPTSVQVDTNRQP